MRCSALRYRFAASRHAVRGARARRVRRGETSASLPVFSTPSSVSTAAWSVITHVGRGRGPCSAPSQVDQRSPVGGPSMSTPARPSRSTGAGPRRRRWTGSSSSKRRRRFLTGGTSSSCSRNAGSPDGRCPPAARFSWWRRQAGGTGGRVQVTSRTAVDMPHLLRAPPVAPARCRAVSRASAGHDNRFSTPRRCGGHVSSGAPTCAGRSADGAAS